MKRKMMAMAMALWLGSSAGAQEQAKQPARGEDRLRSAVQTRCMQECDWLGRAWSTEKPSADKLQQCRAACVEKKKVETALALEPADGWGLSKEDAIEVCLPTGERAFIEDLRCADGETPTYQRSGNVGPRHPPAKEVQTDLELMMDLTGKLDPDGVDRHIVDRYEVNCAGTVHVLFFDMYHCGSPKPWHAPKGFSRPLP